MEQIAVARLFRVAVLPAAFLRPFPWPPMLAIAVSVQCALASNRNVLLLESIDERRKVHQFGAFPSCEHQGISSRVATKPNCGAFLDVEIHPAQEMNRAGEVVSRWNDHSATSGGVASGNGSAKSGSTIGFVVADGAKLQDVPAAIWELRRLNALKDLWHFCPRAV